VTYLWRENWQNEKKERAASCCTCERERKRIRVRRGWSTRKRELINLGYVKQKKGEEKNE
jgi:hypothetical protein